MKLLFVGTNRGGGGTESHFVTLAKAMRQQGHEVAAVVLADAPIHRGLQDSGVHIRTGTFRNALDPRGIRAVWRACSEFQPDWIVGSFSKEYWPLAVIGRLRGAKVALFKHMDFPLRPVTHFFIPRLAQRFIVISKFMRDNFIARGIAPARIQILYNPLDLDYFRPDETLRASSRAQFGFAEDDIVVGFVGALHRDKGIFVLAEALHLAMAELPALKALWVGEGPDGPALQAHIQNGGYQGRHVCHGWSTDVRPYYAAMDILAAPTLVTETFGRVSIEAQASGVAVLCSDLGGLPETLEPDVTGKLLPVGDVTAWRDAIFKLAGDAQLRREFQRNGRTWVNRKFGAAAIAAEFSRILAQAR
ncbi:MAG: glycosyltransferase family 1 protein [Gallionellaceae bacterium]|nr:MAG: glycosyltransferase family 1 protein [Gallionellaceae bacterium]